MTEPTSQDTASHSALEQGSYQLIKRRLSNFGSELRTQVDDLNSQRVDAFGSTELKVQGRARVRTEHNCIPRDIVLIGDKLIFAYNVFMGLKQSTHVSDVFSVQKLVQQDDHYEVEPYPSETKFLTDARFLRDFEELYTYYKETRLQHLFVQGGKLFALFQIGDRLSDVRVFRWQIATDNTLDYIDNRGERDISAHSGFDFEWIKTDRAQHEEGRHPHINVLDKVFVETVGGDLTIKIENNTETGEGIYSEPVEDSNQSLADCELYYAQVGELILLRVLPYREKQWRYFIYNCRSQQVVRQDAIGQACVQLPEDHGIIFPGGYYLQSGQTRYFEDKIEDLEFHRQLKSPNGEDVLYVFYEPTEGRYALFAYNIIEKNLQNPIYCHGYGIYEDGLTLTFKAEQEEAERVHPIQIWQSPFCSAEFAANAPAPTSGLGRIGNPDLVRAISDLYSVCKAISEQNPSVFHYEDLISHTRGILDRYHWLAEADFSTINSQLHDIFETSEQVLDEFEKVSQIQQSARQAEADIEQESHQVLREVRPDSFKLASEFVASLDALKLLKGKVISLEEVKYINLDVLSTIQANIDEQTRILSHATAIFLQQDKALAPYHEQLQEINEKSEQSDSVTELKGYLGSLETLGGELDLLNHTMLDLEIEDSRVRTQILEDVSGVYALVNRAKAAVEIRRKSLGSVEAKAEFAARFKLFSQSITSALSAAKTPEQCDEQLSRLLIQLEELESQFSEYDEFLGEILAKRDDVYESFEAHKQQLIDERQRRALNLATAAERILQGVSRRTQSFTELDQINSYFASDPMISKLRSLTQELKELGDEVKADDIAAKLKASKDQGIRSLRDKQDIYSDGGKTVKIGKHGFSVNKQVLDLTLLPRDDELMLHLTGTEYFDVIPDQQARSQLAQAADYWAQTLPSESAEIYRGEFLAAQILRAAQRGESGLSMEQLQRAQQEDSLLTLVQAFAEPRYQEGYEKGIHDFDATRILSALLKQKSELGLLIYPASCRVMAQLFVSALEREKLQPLQQQATQAQLMATTLNDPRFNQLLIGELSEQMSDFAAQLGDYTKSLAQYSAQLSAEYLIQVLAGRNGLPQFEVQAEARKLAEQFQSMAKAKGFWQTLQETFAELTSLSEKCRLASGWLNAYGEQHNADLDCQIEAASYLLLVEHQALSYQVQDVQTQTHVSGLMGQHLRIEEQTLALDYAEFLARTSAYIEQALPAYQRYQQLKADVLQAQKARLQLEEFKPRPLSSFVRNQLIDKVYFPIIGDNLAKQIGASGSAKRTDLMGMLLLISPPGYGKTTLIEYVANRLGLTFVKVNCPSIGHDQVSLDPSQAINATAAKEIDKINQSFEMGNNVMLYLDDIQHTNPEFLQKFISLCDGSRRIDGVWNGKSKTYDLRGKKFAVVMAGNPYTESGESFKIPDMLANRADIYNLGDTLAGCEQEFAMSFLENALTSNAVLAPLANRNMADLYKLVRIAQGEDISLNELEYGYSQAQANEITAVLQKLLVIRETVLKVNAQYIASAAQDDNYRTEPPFKLQGSYRNMNKMAEKVVAAMNQEELENLIQDHYRGEAQTLSKGSEENLLKLGELRNTLTAQENERWAQIKADYARLNRANDAGSPALLAVEQLAEVSGALSQIASRLDKSQLSHNYSEQFEGLRAILGEQGVTAQLQQLSRQAEQPAILKALEQLTEQHKAQNQQLPHWLETITETINSAAQNSGSATRQGQAELKEVLEVLVAYQQSGQSELVQTLSETVGQALAQSDKLAASNQATLLSALDSVLRQQQTNMSAQAQDVSNALAQSVAGLAHHQSALDNVLASLSSQQQSEQMKQSDAQQVLIADLTAQLARIQSANVQVDNYSDDASAQALAAVTELLSQMHQASQQGNDAGLRAQLTEILDKLDNLQLAPADSNEPRGENPYML
ncbi:MULTISPECIES: DNA repair ATPase [unclassified Pseudoalteromonas]|uniref:DNA repair ATPase n=1 Tax=unclassified Pseudoalteromonas TaxID=194690 RepID=UPI0020968C32|nr:DNA repair ATPase [Pseudoalteromonas sp. XMcav2-N]MCO7188914.1 DNA repair ATPase [Pseudoalteromonas sp. XMcav2-N]